MFVLNSTFKWKSENGMRHVTFETFSWRHGIINFLHLIIACTTVFFLYCYVLDSSHPSDWSVRIIRQVTSNLPHLLTIRNGQGNTSLVSISWFLTHHMAGGVWFCLFTLNKHGVLFLTCVSLMKSMHWNSYWNVSSQPIKWIQNILYSYFFQAKVILWCYWE